MLDQVDLSGVPDGLLPDVQALIGRHAYMVDGTLGSIDATVHRLEIQTGTNPIRQQTYRAGHHARDMIRDEVNRMLEAKDVRPSTSEWESPVVVVPKKDGSPRCCVDYRPGVVRICILGRNRIRMHADASYLITDKSLSSDLDTDICLRNRIIK